MWPFNWFSKEKDNPNVYLNAQPGLNNKFMVPIPAVNPCKPEELKVISEPILSFVELFKKNHRRFTAMPFFRTYVYGECYTLKDKVTGEVFEILVCLGRFKVYDNPWVSEEEVKYIYNVISTFHKERAKRKAELVNSRKRKKYMKIYGPKEEI